MPQRRQFLIKGPLGLLAVAGATRAEPTPQAAPPGAPPTFGATPAVGPELTPATFAEAEKLMQVRMTPAQRQMAGAPGRPRDRRRQIPRAAARHALWREGLGEQHRAGHVQARLAGERPPGF